jgi:hypothetical protein
MIISGKRPEDDDDDEEAGDKYLNVEVIINMGTNDADEWFNIRGDWTTNPSANPLSDTREYEIEFAEGGPF